MQAIADIIVNSSSDSQVKELQLSKNLNNTQNSSNSTSFADMIRSEQSKSVSDESKSVQKSEENNAKKPVKESPKAEEKDSTEKTSEKKDDQTKEKVAASKNEVSEEIKIEVKPRVLVNFDKSKEVAEAKTENKKDIKSNKKVSDGNLKKLDKEANRFNEMLESGKIAENVPEQLVLSEIPVKAEVEIQDLDSDSIDVSEIALSTESASEDFVNTLNFTGAGNNSVSKLDKDGKIIVRDLRTEVEEKQSSVKKDLDLNTKVEITEEGNANITMELASQNVENNILSSNNQTAASNGSDFQAMLNNQIQQQAPEFVKAGSIILKDKDQGTINLVLHPDDLGDVKIHLSLDGKTLSAHITVNTKEAMEVFKDNAQTLREAFAQNGFDTSNFDVSYGNQNGNSNQNFENNYDGTEFYAKKAYSDSIDEENSYIQDYSSENILEYSVNIVA